MFSALPQIADIAKSEFHNAVARLADACNIGGGSVGALIGTSWFMPDVPVAAATL